ncbi:MAG: SUF system NifU family Fe-S cluster assembly protein [Nanoarchaeota archaeon]|nr:SUF system NifU family Fe-S cluster assembly protein [Nanoarchaeota archaeon]
MAYDIYQENILDHYENPRNFGHILNCTAKAHDTNPLCGDMFDFEVAVSEGRIQDVRFNGKGCAISTASASMLTEKIKNMTVEEAMKIEREDITEMLGVELSHVRIKCAMLPLKVMKLALIECKK